MGRLMYWVMGLLGFVLEGANVAAEFVAKKADRGMDYISDHTDHVREEFRF